MILEGKVAPGFESVQQLYEQNMQKLAERNTQLCVYVGDECVVDLWGSAIDDSSFNGDSLVNVFSSSKTLESILLARLFDKGLIDYNEPIATYWPEFCQQGGQPSSTTIADMMRHEAGLAAFDASIPLASLQADAIKQNAIGKIIEQQSQMFRDGADNQREYHALTRGFIANEVFRRVEPQGRTMGEYLRQEITGPLGADAYLGLRDAELQRHCDGVMLGFGYVFAQGLIPKVLGRKMELNLAQTIGRVATLRSNLGNGSRGKTPPPLEGMKKISIFDSPEVNSGEIPSAGAKCSARGLAKLAQVMANGGTAGGVEVLSESAWSAMHAAPVERNMLMMDTTFTQGGLATFATAGSQASKLDRGLNNGREGYFGWMGLGGSVFQWHPEKKIGFAYVPTSLNLLDVVNERGKGYQAEVARVVG